MSGTTLGGRSDAKGQSRIVSGADDSGLYGMFLQDAKGVPRIVIGGNAEDVWGISFVDAAGQPVLGVPFGPGTAAP